MSLLSIVQDTCRRLLLSAPNPPTAFLSNEEKIQQLVQAANSTCRDIAVRYPWQALVRQTLFTTFNGYVQGPISILAPDGFSYIISGSFYNRTQNHQIGGPLTSEEWQSVQAGAAYEAHGGSLFFRLQGNDLLLTPIPALGELCALEYVTSNWNGGSDRFGADTDVPVFDEELVIRGTKWRYLQAVGYDYAEAFREYENLLMDVSARDGSKRPQAMGNPPPRGGPVFTYGNIFGGTV